MKNPFKVFCFLVVFVIIGLQVITCDSVPKNSSEPSGPSQLSEPMAFNDITAVQLVAEIKLGWNLGNTLDAAGRAYSSSVDQHETQWVNTKTTQKHFSTLKSAGFNAVRIPVSWAKVTNSEYVIRTDWMNRVAEIVSYAAAEDMYILLNTHHDEDLFKFTNDKKDKGIKAFKKMWEQIAEKFKDYNEKLVFEALNEPRTKRSSAEWNGGTQDERKNLNEYYQVFVDVVRATGSNNAKRILLINPYGASSSASAMNGFEIPKDTVPNKIIVSYHNYAPYNFALNTDSAYNTWSESTQSDKTAITNPMDSYKKKFIDNGIPVLIGEYGAMNKDNLTDRENWAKFYVSEGKKRGIPCFWWDNASTTGNGEKFGLMNRANYTWAYPAIVEALVSGTK